MAIHKPAIGLTLPLKKGSNGYFQQSFDLLTQVKSNIANLLLTKKGERIMYPTFGCGIHQYLFSPMTDDNLSNIKGTINEAINIWLPYVKTESIHLTPNYDYNKLKIDIVFSIKNNITLSDTVTILI